MGFFSRLFGKKDYEEVLKEDSAKIIEKAENAKTEFDLMEKMEKAKFLFKAEDIFTITGRGSVVTGVVLRGNVKYNDVVTVNDMQATVVGIESFRKQVNVAKEGDRVGILLKEIKRNQVKKGDFLYK